MSSDRLQREIEAAMFRQRMLQRFDSLFLDENGRLDPEAVKYIPRHTEYK
jgi:hypothetical protein